MINVGGYKVNPSKVEDIIRTFNFVEDILITSKKNSVMGNIVIAKIITDNEDDVIEFIKNTDKLKKYEKPLKIEFVDSFKLTNTGKLKRA